MIDFFPRFMKFFNHSSFSLEQREGDLLGHFPCTKVVSLYAVLMTKNCLQKITKMLHLKIAQDVNNYEKSPLMQQSCTQ